MFSSSSQKKTKTKTTMYPYYRRHRAHDDAALATATTMGPADARARRGQEESGQYNKVACW
jgi:hypothetical protein